MLLSNPGSNCIHEELLEQKNKTQMNRCPISQLLQNIGENNRIHGWNVCLCRKIMNVCTKLSDNLYSVSTAEEAHKLQDFETPDVYFKFAINLLK